MLPARPISLRWWLGVLVAAVALPLILLLIWLFGSQVQRERKDARELALRVAHGTALRLREQNADANGLLERLAERPAFRNFDAAACESLFAVIDFEPEDENLFFFLPDGRLLCSGSPRKEALAVSAVVQQWIAEAVRSGALRPRVPLMRVVNRRWVSVVSHPVHGEDGVLRGTLALMQLTDAFDETLAPDALTTIIDERGVIVARSDRAQQWVGRPGNAAILALARRGGQGLAQAQGIDGVVRQYGFTSIPEIGWYVYAGIPSSVVMEPVRQMFVRGVEGGVVIVIIVIAIAATLSRGIERPIKIMVGTAEQRMLDDERKLKALSDRLLVVQEAERSRIARELHDDLGQSLTALKMDIIGLLAKTEQQYGRSPIANRILRTLEAMVTSVQRISSELRPSILDDLGLVPALESEAMMFEDRTGIECELSLPDARIEAHLATAIYRIVQEALTNVARHSNASRVEIRLRERTDELLLEIRDDGRGVTVDEVGDPRSLGLLGIRERADLVGGTVHFEGVSGRGTIVSVRIPISLTPRSKS